TAAWLGRPICFLCDWYSHFREYDALLRQWSTSQSFLNRPELLKTLELEHTFNKRSRSRPARRIHLKSCKSGITEQTNNADVSNRNLTKKKTLSRNLRLQIVKHTWHIFFQGLLHYRFVGLFTPDCGLNGNLIEQPPDKYLTHPRISKLFQPSGTCTIG